MHSDHSVFLFQSTAGKIVQTGLLHAANTHPDFVSFPAIIILFSKAHSFSRPSHSLSLSEFPTSSSSLPSVKGRGDTSGSAIGFMNLPVPLAVPASSSMSSLLFLCLRAAVQLSEASRIYWGHAQARSIMVLEYLWK